MKEKAGSCWTSPTEVDGLYDPALEKEACGVGFVVQIDGIRSNKVTEFISVFLFFFFCFLLFGFFLRFQIFGNYLDVYDILFFVCVLDSTRCPHVGFPSQPSRSLFLR